jgi:hypothetical protein
VKRSLVHLLCLVGILTATVALISCGGQPGPAQVDRTGSARFTIEWPQPSGRLVPLASRSIRIRAFIAGADPLEPIVQIAVRNEAESTTTVFFEKLPAVEVRFVAEAMPEPNGTGIPMASGAVSFEIESNKTTSQALTLDSSITQIKILASSFSFTINEGASLAAQALDKDDRIVLTSPDKLEWSSDAPGILSVPSSGNPVLAIPIVRGQTKVHLTDSESGVTTEATVQVFDPIRVSPAQAVCECGESVSFTANREDVTWSASGGSISQAGVYTAGNEPGTFSVSASSGASGGSATVIVKCPTLAGNWKGQLLPKTVADMCVPGQTIGGRADVRFSVLLSGTSGRLRVDAPGEPFRFEAYFEIFDLVGSPARVVGSAESGRTVTMSVLLDRDGEEYLEVVLEGAGIQGVSCFTSVTGGRFGDVKFFDPLGLVTVNEGIDVNGDGFVDILGWMTRSGNIPNLGQHER